MLRVVVFFKGEEGGGVWGGMPGDACSSIKSVSSSHPHPHPQLAPPLPPFWLMWADDILPMLGAGDSGSNDGGGGGLWIGETMLQ